MVETITKEPIQYGRVTNPTNEDLNFFYDSAPYILRAGDTENKWTVHHSMLAAKKLADKNIMTSNPEEHRVLTGAYLSNSPVDVIANNLGINIIKIRKKAMTKEDKKARVINLEVSMLEMKEQIKELKAKKVVEPKVVVVPKVKAAKKGKKVK